MKLFENYKVVKTIEYAFLIKAFVEEMDKKIQFWLPKAKAEENDNTLSVEQETWDKKLEELKTKNINGLKLIVLKIILDIMFMLQILFYLIQFINTQEMTLVAE